MLGARAASGRFVALVDADVVLGTARSRVCVDELAAGGYDAIQAGLESVSGPGYWGRALAHHHRSGPEQALVRPRGDRARARDLLEHGFDRASVGRGHRAALAPARSGAQGRRLRATVVEHRFGDTFAFAKGQWLADGGGPRRMIRKYGLRAAPLLGLPLAAGLRGALSSARSGSNRAGSPTTSASRVFNYAGMARRLARRLRWRPEASRSSHRRAGAKQPLSVTWNALARHGRQGR